MDFKFKGRTWAGNIYHRFETMCQEVDDFVTKDSVKYVENQVQTVGESMKKIYSNVVHDFLPSVVDNKPNEGQLVAKKQNDVIGTYIRSMVGIKGKLGHANERKSSKENGNASEVGHQRQYGLPPILSHHQQAESDLYSEGGGIICISKNAEVVREENVSQEESPVPRFLSSQDEESSINLREEHPLPESLDSPEDQNLSGSSEISNGREQRSIFLPRFSAEENADDGDFRISQNDTTVPNSNDLSEEAKPGLSLEQDCVNAIYKNSKMGPEENVANKEHPVSEGAKFFKEKDSSGLTSCTKGQHQMANDSHFLQHENSLVLSSAKEDFKSNIQAKLSPVMLSHDTGLRVVQMEETVCDNADPSEEAGANSSSEQNGNVANFGVSLEENVAKDKPLVVECKSFSNDKSFLDLSQCSREQHPLIEEISNLEDENFTESSVIPANENPTVTIWAKFPPANSVHEQELRDSQDEESLCDIADPSNEAETNLSLETDGDGICLFSDLAGEEDCMLMKYAVEDYISPFELKSSSGLSLCSTKLHLQAEELDSLEDDNLLKSSPPLSDIDHKDSVLTNISQAISVHDAELRASQMDETICSRNPSSELVSSKIYVENKVAEAEVTSLNSSVSIESLYLPDISYANYAQKAERSCSNYIDSSSCVSYSSSISSESFTDLAFDNKAVNLIRAFSSRADSAVSSGHGDDPPVDIGDPEMEAIDLSDKVNLDGSCIIVDNILHYAASSRPKKFRSYKKLIQDAFASRKRLIKEYELLAIWYGDIEMETCPRPKQSLLPPVTATTSSSRTSQTSDMCEPEWELL